MGCLFRIRVFFRFFFPEVFYSRTKREGNKVTHYLTKLAANFLDIVIWMEDISPFIFAFVQANLTSFLK